MNKCDDDENLTAPIKTFLVAVIDDIVFKLETTFTGDLQLGAQAFIFFIRTNLDDMLDRMEENIIAVLIDNLESVSLAVSNLIGMICIFVTVVMRF